MNYIIMYLFLMGVTNLFAADEKKKEKSLKKQSLLLTFSPSHKSSSLQSSSSSSSKVSFYGKDDLSLKGSLPDIITERKSNDSSNDDVFDIPGTPNRFGARESKSDFFRKKMFIRRKNKELLQENSPINETLTLITHIINGDYEKKKQQEKQSMNHYTDACRCLMKNLNKTLPDSIDKYHYLLSSYHIIPLVESIQNIFNFPITLDYNDYVQYQEHCYQKINNNKESDDNVEKILDKVEENLGDVVERYIAWLKEKDKWIEMLGQLMFLANDQGRIVIQNTAQQKNCLNENQDGTDIHVLHKEISGKDTNNIKNALTFLAKDSWINVINKVEQKTGEILLNDPLEIYLQLWKFLVMHDHFMIKEEDIEKIFELIQNNKLKRFDKMNVFVTIVNIDDLKRKLCDAKKTRIKKG